jgi:pyruvate dehydrogenase E2 component (dihydrolipoyllysine-residue acetyltransferase)
VLAVSVAPVASAPAVAERVQERAAVSESGVSTSWRLMAERTTQSWTTVPHFFLVREVNAVQFVSWRKRAAEQVSDTITFTDLLVKIVAEALRRHPRVNASWSNGAIVANADVNVGLAVATEDGLVVPVIQQADDLSLRAIARQRADLVARAQSAQLRLRDLQGGTFTISNLGMYGIDAFNAIINAPQAAILAVGRIVERVVPVDGQPAVQPTLTLTLSCDHRVVDGARGAEFLATVAKLIEQPADLAG